MKLSSFSNKTLALAVLVSASSLAGYAQTTLSLASGSAAPGVSTILNLSLNSVSGSEPSGLQWKLSYPAGVSSATLTAGAALGTAGKTLSCNPGSGYVVCVAAGNNSATIPNGVLAAVNLTLAPNVTASSLAIGVVETAAVGGTGSATASSGTGGSISVTGIQPLISVAGLTCSPTALTTPATASCAISLSSAAPSGGVSVTLASNNSLVTVPPSIMVSSGSSSASFTASAGSCTSSSNATVTASLNGSSSAFLTLQPSGSTTAPPAGLVAAYGFNEGSGSTVSDASGNGNVGQIQSATWTAGRFGSALSFNGSSSVVNIPDAPVLRMSTAFTLSAWVNPSNVNAWQDIIYKGNDDYFLEASSDRGTPAGGGTFGLVRGSSELRLNTWSHIAVTYDGSSLRYYVNGVEVGSVAANTAVTNTNSPLQIGADNVFGQYFSGLIDEVRVYNVALTAAQIQTDMNTAIPTASAPPAAPSLSSVQCSPASIASGASSSCTVTLSSAAPSGGAAVALSSNNGALSVPASINVAAGATTATFNASAGSVTSNQSATVTATYNSKTVTAAVTITAPVTTAPAIAAFSCSPTTIDSGATSTCTVKLSAAAPSGGATVSIADSNTVVISAPSSVSVAAGSTSATFQATASILKTNRSATLTAGYASKSMTVTITVRKRR